MSVVLLTNDDGVHAEGLAALGRAFAELGEVYIVAPEREQSACGHALTLHRPIRPVQLGERVGRVARRRQLLLDPVELERRVPGGRQLDHEIQHRHGHVEPFDGKPLLAEISLVQEALERVHRRETRQQLLLSVG